MKIATAFVEVRADTAKAEKEIRSKAGGLGKTFAQVFGAAAFGAALGKMVDAASGLEQSVGAIESVFGDAGKAIDKWAKDAAKNMGLSERAANEALALIGAQLKNFGFSVDESRDKGKELVELGADLAATFGGTTTQAVEALSAVLRGEMNPIERYGVSINDVRLKAKALEMGLHTGKGALDSNAKAQAALALVTEQTADAQGQFAREADTAAGAAQIAAAQTENASASMGDNLLPIYTRAKELIGDVAAAFGALPGPIQTGIIALAGFVALSGPIKSVMSLMGDLTKRMRDLGPTTKAAGAALGVFGAVAVVGLSIRAKQAADRMKAIAQGINDLSRASDAAALQVFVDTMLELALAGKGGADAVAEMAAQNLEGTRRILDLATAAGIQNEAVGWLTEAITKEEAARAQAAVTADKYGDAVADATGAAIDNAGAVTDQASAADDSRAANDRLTDSLHSTFDAFDAAASAADALSKAINDVFGPTIDMEEATRRLQQNADDLTESFKKNGATLDVTTEKGRDNRKAVQEQVDAVLDYGVAMVGAGGSIEDANSAVDFFTAGLRNQMRQAGMTDDQINDYLTTLGLTPENVKTTIELAKDEAAKAKLRDLQDQLGDISEGAAAEIDALIKQSKFDEAEAMLRKLARDRTSTLTVSIETTGRMPQVTRGGKLIAAAEGGVRDTPGLTMWAEDGREAILPLTKPARLAQIVNDARVRGPVLDALGHQGGAMQIVNDNGITINGLHTGTTAGELRSELDRVAWLAAAR